VLAALLVAVSLTAAGPQPSETIAAVQVHGNTLTTDDEVRRLAGVSIGSRVDDSTVEAAASRLRSAGTFVHVDVFKRFASISDPTQILLVIVVDEGPVRIETSTDPDAPVRIVKDHRLKMMVLPVISAEDGYGLTYGARFARPDAAGKNSRVAFPLTWGGEKRAGIEFDKTVTGLPIDRVLAGAAVSSRNNPYYEEDDNRSSLWLRSEKLVGHVLRTGATVGWQRVTFPVVVGGPRESGAFAYAGADVTLDTRADPVLPRNGVLARAAWEHVAGVNRIDLDARGYLGVFRQNVLNVRVMKSDADATLPLYLKPLLGGMSNLRGFRTGTAAGDTLVATSAELVVPITSPVSVGRLGVSAFVDAGTAYDKGQRLADQEWKRGIGGSVWFTAAFFRLNLAVAHGRDGSTRVHVGANVSF
jgi:outer membrane protein assembly factor BamA